MSILTVGPSGQYHTISAAVAASHSGDVIQVQAGTYTNDFPPTINHNLTLQAVGGRVNMDATQAPGNGKAILDVGAGGVTVTVTGFSFSGAHVADGNGAGIRYEGGNLILVNDYFHDNQDGLLAASDTAGSITIANTEFSHNGAGDGYTHNLYVNEVGTLNILNSYFTGVAVGHEIKSRALNTTVVDSRIQDGPTGTASYDIDLPNGGRALITGNVIEKGPDAQNPTIITSGEEGGVYGGSALIVAGNTILNDKSGSVLAVRNQTAATALIEADRFYGLSASQIASGPAHVAGSSFLTTEPTLNTAPPFTNTVLAAQVLAAGGSATTHAGTSNLVVLTTGSENVAANGTDTVLAGSGSDTVHAGAGHVSVVGGLGTLTFLGGAGIASIVLEPSTKSDIVLNGAGTVTLAGAATVTGGSGADLYNLVSGYGGSDVINHFHVGIDHLRLNGFASGTAQNVVAGATNTSAGTVLHLPDGTQITLTGIHSVTTGIFG